MAGRPCIETHPDPVGYGCHHCNLYLTDWRYRALWDGMPRDGAPGAKAGDGPRRLGRGRCEHLGPETGERRSCNTCAARGKQIDVHECKRHGLCTIDLAVPGAALCRVCDDWKPAVPVSNSIARRRAQKQLAAIPPEPSFVKRLDHVNCWPGNPGRRFNSSIAQWEDGFLFAYRTGWEGSEIYLGRLDAELNPVGQPWKLELYHATEAHYGREDVRLFWHRKRLHVTYVGVRKKFQSSRVSVLYARLGEDLRVEQVYYPHYHRRNPWEKNWMFFPWGGDLYAVYSVSPHRILRIEGSEAELAYESQTAPAWEPGTELRGGACPVLHQGEWWHFFHSRFERPARRYTMGVCTFEDRPPFRITRITPRPLLVADPRTNVGEDPNHCAVVFPCGATLVERDNDKPHWLVSMGVHDRCTEFHRWDHADLESRMVRVAGDEPPQLPDPIACYI